MWSPGDRESCGAGILSPEAAIILPQSSLHGVSVDRDANFNLSGKDFCWSTQGGVCGVCVCIQNRERNTYMFVGHMKLCNSYFLDTSELSVANSFEGGY